MRKFSIKHNMPIYWDVRWRGTQTFFNNTLAGKELIRECFLLYEKSPSPRLCSVSGLCHMPCALYSLYTTYAIHAI